MQPCYISLVCHARSNSNDVIALAINIPRQIEAREGEGGGGRGGGEEKWKKEDSSTRFSFFLSLSFDYTRVMCYR